MTAQAESLRWIERLQQRQPTNKNRYATFYRGLDESEPKWSSILGSPSFLQWASARDHVSGSTVLEMLQALWEDPVGSSEQFATILRLYQSRAELPPQRKVSSGKYEILKALGSGGNGDVFLVWSRETRCLYGLKVIRSSLCHEPSVLSRFKKEVETWVNIGAHPNIVKANFLDVIRDALHMTMEYIEGDGTCGPSLTDKLRQRSIDPNHIAAWFAQVADGLDHAYHRGVASHRDLKPGNILVARDGTAKVTDFGLVALVRTSQGAAASQHWGNPGDTAPGSLLGTPPYMAPEQFYDASQCDQRSDIYSLGITLYQTVSGGRLPFLPNLPKNPGPLDQQRFLLELRSMHESAQIPRLRSSFWPVIEKCLAKDPSHRFANIREFRAAIEAVAKANQLQVPRQAEPDDDIWSYRDKGNTLLRLGKYEEAITAFETFRARIPDDSVLFNKAVCLENLGRLNEALDIYRRFIEQNDFKACINAANCLRRLGEHVSAVEFALQATQLEPEDADCWIALGNAKYASSLFPEAVVAYRRAVTISPSEATPHYNLGLARKEAGDKQGAARSLTRFLNLASPLDSRRSLVASLLKDLAFKA